MHNPRHLAHLAAAYGMVLLSGVAIASAATSPVALAAPDSVCVDWTQYPTELATGGRTAGSTVTLADIEGTGIDLRLTWVTDHRDGNIIDTTTGGDFTSLLQYVALLGSNATSQSVLRYWADTNNGGELVFEFLDTGTTNAASVFVESLLTGGNRKFTTRPWGVSEIALTIGGSPAPSSYASPDTTVTDVDPADGLTGYQTSPIIELDVPQYGSSNSSAYNETRNSYVSVGANEVRDWTVFDWGGPAGVEADTITWNLYGQGSMTSPKPSAETTDPTTHQAHNGLSGYIGGLCFTDPAAVVAAVSVGDYVWLDSDRDGIQDAEEDGIEGVVLTLTGPGGVAVNDVSGNPVDPATTAADGSYSFDNLPALATGESYTVTVTDPAGFVPTLGEQDAATGSSTGSAASGDLTTDGARDATLDFGYVRIDLQLSKTLMTTSPVSPGGSVTFDLVPFNNGPAGALAGWSVTEVLPAGLTLVSMSGSGYTCTGATCVADAGLATGTSGPTITVVTTLNASATVPLRNVAYVSPSDDDIVEDIPLVVPTNGTDTASSATNNDAEAAITLAPPVTPELPETGAESSGLLRIALSMLVLGVGLVLGTRKRTLAGG